MYVYIMMMTMILFFLLWQHTHMTCNLGL